MQDIRMLVISLVALIGCFIYLYVDAKRKEKKLSKKEKYISITLFQKKLLLARRRKRRGK